MIERITFRCFSAGLLLVLFGLSLLTPLFGSDAQSDLPACCRRDGKHHCVASSKSSGSGPAFESTARCPLYPGVSPATVQSLAVILPVAAAIFFSTNRAACRSRDLLLVCLPADRAHPKRGPPFSFSVIPG